MDLSVSVVTKTQSEKSISWSRIIFRMSQLQFYCYINNSRLTFSFEWGLSVVKAGSYWKIRFAQGSRLLMCKFNQISNNLDLIFWCCVYSIFIFTICTEHQCHKNLIVSDQISTFTAVSCNISEKPGCHALLIFFIFQQEKSFGPSWVCTSTIEWSSLIYS